MARPERFELPTARFVAEYSIQLSYGRIVWLIGGENHGHVYDENQPFGKASARWQPVLAGA